jgi:integrase
MLLRNFHSLVSREMAVDDPDWSEVPGGEELLSISPGYILEKEYQYALGVLVTNPQSASFDELATAFVLLLCYRFGLRGAEACGLMRSDWVDAVPDNPLVLVRSNKLRALKTINARRQVPLLFQLSALEHEIIDRYLALWQGHAMGQVDLPLFFEPGNVAQLINDRLCV